MNANGTQSNDTRERADQRLVRICFIFALVVHLAAVPFIGILHTDLKSDITTTLEHFKNGLNRPEFTRGPEISS